MEVATNEALCPPSTQPRHALSQHDLGSLVLSSVQQTWFFCPQELAALWGEHLSQAHMPTEINSDTPGRSELNSILTPPPSSSYYLLVSHSPPQKPYCLQSPQHRQIYQKTTWDGNNSPWQVHISQVSTQVCPSRKLPETRAQPGVP